MTHTLVEADPEPSRDRTVETLAGLVGAFDPIALADLGESELLRRVDRKYMVPIDDLSALIAPVRPSYRALEAGGTRLARYSTQYFDTPSLTLYHEHHRGNKPRSKVRIRTYEDTGERFIEVKVRLNARGTLKSRLAVPEGEEFPLGLLDRMPAAQGALGDAIPTLQESVRVQYRRITLVHRTAPERVTIDIGLALSLGDRTVSFPRVGCIEVKQDRRLKSPFVDRLRAAKVPEGSMSKYCLGVVSLVDWARKNRFKQSARRFQTTGKRNGRITLE